MLVQTVVLICTIPQFRARIQKLNNRLGAKSWSSSRGVRLVFGEYPYVETIYHVNVGTDNLPTIGMLRLAPDIEKRREQLTDIERPSTRASWIVLAWSASSMRPWSDPRKGGGRYSASLEVYEEAENRIRVDFLDGYHPEDPQQDYLQIGEPFEEFTTMLIEEMKDIVEDLNIASGQNALSNKLLDILIDFYSEDELRTLCFRLEVDYESLPAVAKEGKARELILYLKRRKQIEKIIEIGKKDRQDIDWPGNHLDQ